MKVGCPSEAAAQEASARLTVIYPEPAAVTAATGIKPDLSWRAGDTRPNSSLPAKFGSWRLVEDEAGIPSDRWYGEYVGRCLRRLLLRVQPGEFRRRLVRLDPELRPSVVLTGLVNGLPNLHISADLIAMVAALGADLEEDFYALPVLGNAAPHLGNPI